jgi:serine/threonine protein kinase
LVSTQSHDGPLAFEPGKVIAGRYRLREIVGYGSMGSVWKAEHAALGTHVAIKLLHAQGLGDRPEAERRFALEARAAAALRGPHVVQIMDHGVDGGVPYIVLELLEGESLEEHLLRTRRMSLQKTVRLVSHVARALERARQVGYIHRDLKPSNIFLARGEAQTSRNEDWVAKVLDFGLAKSSVEARPSEQSSLTEIGKIVGTPKYMSPEQVRGGTIDHRSDQWSLAIIAYECLVGAPPFDGETLQDLMLAICEQPPRPPTHVDPALPVELDAWFARATAKAPEGRYPSATELAQALAALAASKAGLRPVARPPRPSRPKLEIGLDSTVLADALNTHLDDTVTLEAGPVSSRGGSSPALTEEDDDATIDSRRGPAPRMSMPTGELIELYQSPLDLDELTTYWEGSSQPVQPESTSSTIKLAERLFVRHGDAQVGPVQVLEVLQALRDGLISPRSMARPLSSTTWRPLEELRLVDESGRALDVANIQPAPRPPRDAGPGPAPPAAVQRPRRSLARLPALLLVVLLLAVLVIVVWLRGGAAP